MGFLELFILSKEAFLQKIAGPKFLEILLSYVNKKVVVVGNLDKKELSYLNKRNISVVRNIPLLKYRFEDLKKITLESEIEVIITLPSPLQEETAFFLHKKYPNLNFFLYRRSTKNALLSGT